MADFCNACHVELFGPLPALENRDLSLLTIEEHWKEGRAATVICEGCGPIQVDPEGNCVSPNCDKAGKSGHGLPWLVDTSEDDD